VTGAKHYMGPFEAYAKSQMVTPFREEQPRLPYQNFYYEQEDEVFAAADRQGFSWSVHRPHTLIGYAVGNQMNMAATLGAYAAICRKRAVPSSFPVHRSSTKPSWTSPMGASLPSTCFGRQRSPLLETTPSTSSTVRCSGGTGCGRSLPNIWGWLRPNIGHAQPLEQQMAGMEAVWDKIVAKHGLRKNPLSTVASWWHSDADLVGSLRTSTT
jgi:hypothetical protein